MDVHVLVYIYTIYYEYWCFSMTIMTTFSYSYTCSESQF